MEVMCALKFKTPHFELSVVTMTHSHHLPAGFTASLSCFLMLLLLGIIITRRSRKVPCAQCSQANVYGKLFDGGAGAHMSPPKSSWENAFRHADRPHCTSFYAEVPSEGRSTKVRHCMSLGDVPSVSVQRRCPRTCIAGCYSPNPLYNIFNIRCFTVIFSLVQKQKFQNFCVHDTTIMIQACVILDADEPPQLEEEVISLDLLVLQSVADVEYGTIAGEMAYSTQCETDDPVYATPQKALFLPPRAYERRPGFDDDERL